MNDSNVLFMASSGNAGLSFNMARLAIALQKTCSKVIVVSQPKEQEKGLFIELAEKGIECYTASELDKLSIKSIISAARKIGKIIEYNDLNVVHAQSIRHLLVAFLASKLFCHTKKIGIVVSVHTILHGSPRESLALLIESMLLNFCADLALPVSRSTANKLISYGLLPQKVKTIYNGIDLVLLDKIIFEEANLSCLPHHFDSSSHLVGYFANMVPRKGHEYLIMAISEVLRVNPNVKLVITSDGPMRDRLENLCKKLGIQESVFFTGRIEYRALYKLLKRIDSYAFPSLAELFPFAILEAMAAGKPIVASNVGGVSEVLKDEENGILIPPRDYDSLAKGIKRLIANPVEAEQMGKKSRSMIEKKFNIQRIAADFAECYRLSIESHSDR